MEGEIPESPRLGLEGKSKLELELELGSLWISVRILRSTINNLEKVPRSRLP